MADFVRPDLLADRRINRRYEITLPLHYRVSERKMVPRSGSATTCDLSSGGLSFVTRKPLPVGAHIELIVDWPSKYGDLYPIDLMMTGLIVRSTEGKTAVRIGSRRFRVNSAAEITYQATA